MEELIHNITSNEDVLIPFMIFGIGGLIAITAIVITNVRGIASTNEREKSRREIAAYIAEGSMMPEDGERLMKANPDKEA